jgi:iron-sulfur cluster repair protein YtfE (RIC family)
MTPNEARATLLDQHDRLRRRLSETTVLAARWLAGDKVSDQLHQALVELRKAFVEHNRTEEALLQPLLSQGDAWGPARIQRMGDEHAAEHAAFLALMGGTDAEVAERIPDIAEDLEAHMAAEERTFLSPAVLRDVRGGAHE